MRDVLNDLPKVFPRRRRKRTTGEWRSARAWSVRLPTISDYIFSHKRLIQQPCPLVGAAGALRLSKTALAQESLRAACQDKPDVSSRPTGS
jgi:hypothetical protein